MDERDMMNKFLEVMKTDTRYVSKYDPEKSKLQSKTKQLVFEYNHTAPKDEEKRRQIIGEILGNKENLLFVETGFNCDYGFNIKPKGFAFINYNCTILDTSPVYIGERVFIAPGVVISCA